MAVTDLVGINLLYIILLIVPGLIGIKVYLTLGKRVDQFSRLDTIVASLVLSIAALFLHYGLVNSLTTGSLEISDVSFTTSLAIHGYLSMVSMCILIAGAVSIMQHNVYSNPSISFPSRFTLSQLLPNNWYNYLNKKSRVFIRDDTSGRQEVWDSIFENIFSNVRVQVVTVNGGVIEGEVLMYGDTVQSRDLILWNQEDDKRQGVESTVSVDGDNYTYIHEQDISYISFLNIEDLDQLRDGPLPDYDKWTDITTESPEAKDKSATLENEMKDTLQDLGINPEEIEDEEIREKLEYLGYL